MYILSRDAESALKKAKNLGHVDQATTNSFTKAITAPAHMAYILPVFQEPQQDAVPRNVKQKPREPAQIWPSD